MGRITKIKLMKIVPMGALDEIEKCHWKLFFEGTKLKLLAAASITETAGWFLHHQKKNPENVGGVRRQVELLRRRKIWHLPTSPTSHGLPRSQQQQLSLKVEGKKLPQKEKCHFYCLRHLVLSLKQIYLCVGVTVPIKKFARLTVVLSLRHGELDYFMARNLKRGKTPGGFHSCVGLR